MFLKTGGNALAPVINNRDQYFKVVVPDGVAPGELILVRCPSQKKQNRIVSVEVPENSYPGYVFLVQVPPPKPVIVDGIPVSINEMMPTRIVRAKVPEDEEEETEDLLFSAETSRVPESPDTEDSTEDYATGEEDEDNDNGESNKIFIEDAEEEYLAFATSDEGSLGASEDDDDDDFLNVASKDSTVSPGDGNSQKSNKREDHDLV